MKVVKTPVTPSIPVLSCGPSTAESITVGQRVVFKCAVDDSFKDVLQPSVHIDLSLAGGPLPPEDAHGLVFLDSPKVDGKILEVPFTSYKVGTHEFKNIEIHLGEKTYLSSPFSFTVQSVLPQQQTGEKNQPQPVPSFDPLSLSAPLWWWVLWISLALVALAVLVKKIIQWRKSRVQQKEKSVEARVLTPLEKFTLALQKLESQGYHTKGEYKSFALELTLILKKAIGEKFKFPAEDLTTEEFFETLSKEKVFFDETKRILEAVLSSLDQIKFAKVQTTQEKCSGLIDMTKEVGRILYRGGS